MSPTLTGSGITQMALIFRDQASRLLGQLWPTNCNRRVGKQTISLECDTGLT